MSNIGVLIPGGRSNGWLLTYRWKWRGYQKVSAFASLRRGLLGPSRNVSWSDQLLIFFIYETQSLDV
ncbi:MAG TPA: hypothetical protein VE242_11925, partial [Chthoniobacterales bacterium]|nr:hypothetical protein [Chthoniobacterales bacterium]